ncbi:MAG: homoaconitase [Bacteroidetes bacterium]|nr:homoaconitase [Bacteroidota bacterium]
MSQNMIEKICQKYAVGLEKGQKVVSGDFISIRPEHIMTHDNTGAVIPKFKGIGATRMANPRQAVFALDHDIQNKDEKNLAKYAKIEAFAKEMGNDFYPAGRGIGHQVMIEEGYAWPGTMVVASDSHSNTYGGVGSLGTPIVRTDAAAIWATGRTWWQVPSVAKVVLNGSLRPGVTGKDVIIALAGRFNKDEVLNFVLEFVGEGVKSLSVEARLTIANMTTEWGALAGVFPIDEVLYTWIEKRIAKVDARGLQGVPSDVDGNGSHPRINKARLEALRSEAPMLQPDVDAFYAKEITFDLSTVEPFIAGPHNVKTMRPASQFKAEKKKIDKAYLLSCTNGRLEDFEQAAKVMEGKKVAEGVKLYVAASSDEIQKDAEALGYWKTFVDAGAIILPASCGPCIGLGEGLLEDGEVGISATNRNFKGRMGSKDAEAYLASPAVVAASAVAGYFDTPYEMESSPIQAEIKVNKKDIAAASVAIVDGFPEVLEGELLFCNQDSMNTDGIYPGKYTYMDDFKPEDQARVVMENYDPEFSGSVKEGDILVGGYTFGTGSSREQAATALKFRGIALVIAGTFNQTYQRNAINNGFLCIESPELVDDFKARYGKANLTEYTGLKAKIDFKNSKIILSDKEYAIGPVGAAAQELIVVGGLENWVKNNL